MSENESVFQRCPHDKENPYVMVSRSLIRDKNISPNCRMLIIYLLSNADGWQIKARELINSFQGYLGRDKIYEIIQEAIDAGYMKREETTVNNLKKYTYYISEFKKFFRCSDPQDTGNQDSKETTTSKNNQSPLPPPQGSPPSPKGKGEEREKEACSPSSSQAKKERESAKASEFNPPRSAICSPSFLASAKERERVIRILLSKKVDVSRLDEVCSFALKDQFWKDKVTDSDSLVKHYLSILKQLPKRFEEMDVHDQMLHLVKEIHDKEPLSCNTLKCRDSSIYESTYQRVYNFNLGYAEIKRRIYELYSLT
jgi:hypothetical protein